MRCPLDDILPQLVAMAQFKQIALTPIPMPLTLSSRLEKLV
jgi:hypothetical protein